MRLNLIHEKPLLETFQGLERAESVEKRICLGNCKEWVMGGPGSGRWHNYEKKLTVEQCYVLDIQHWIHKKVLQPWVSRWDTWAFGWKIIPELASELNTTDMAHPWMGLLYKSLRTHKYAYYRIPLQITQPHYGGYRWWFSCPLTLHGFSCHRRLRTLYLPPGERYFGCRACYNLTYTSCQESHIYDRVYKELATRYPNTVLDYLKGPLW